VKICSNPWRAQKENARENRRKIGGDPLGGFVVDSAPVCRTLTGGPRARPAQSYAAAARPVQSTTAALPAEIDIYIYIYIYMCTYVHTYIHTHTNIHTYIHTYIHTCIYYTHIHIHIYIYILYTHTTAEVAMLL